MTANTAMVNQGATTVVKIVTAGPQGPSGTGGGGISDGDKGDITVSGGGLTWTIDNGAVDTAKLGGDITAAGKALLDDADAAAQRTTLGLAGAATLNVGTTTGTVAAGDDSRITGALSAATAATTYQPLDSDLTAIAALSTTSYGRAYLALVDAAAGRAALGLGTAATTAATDYAPAAQGVTNGNSHDHSGGDGAQIAYSSLSGLPTLLTAVTGTAPIVSSGGTAPAISIAAATTAAAGSMSAADKLKLDGIAAGAEVNVNADWNASSGDAQILNKPTLHDAVTLSASVADILGLSGQELTADDPGTDRLVFWDDSAGKLTHLTVGANLSITGTTLDASGGGGGGISDGDKGDITVSEGGATWTIDNGAVTLAKMENRASGTLIGRHAGGTGTPQEVSVGNGLEFSGSGIRRSALAGDVTASAGSNTTTIANDAVTNAKLANMAVGTIKARISTGTGDPEDASASQIRTLLNVADGATANVAADAAPQSLGATAAIGTSTDYAREDHVHQRDPDTIILACSDETTALTTGTNKVRSRMPFAATLLGVRASVNTAPTGSILEVMIKESGSAILSTKLTIDDGETTSTTAASAAVISDSALADDAQVSIDIDQVGSTIAGAGLKVTLSVRRS